MFDLKINFMIILYVLLLFCSICVVCAEENNTTMNNDLTDEILISNMDDNISNVDNNIQYSNENQIKSNDKTSSYAQETTDENDKLKGILSFKEFYNLIKNNNTIDLEWDVIWKGPNDSPDEKSFVKALFSNPGLEIEKNLVLDGHGHYINGNHRSVLFLLNEEDIKVTIKNLIIKDFGRIMGALRPYHLSGSSDKGAIHVNSKNVDLTLENCSFQDNRAIDGAAIAVSKGGGSLTIKNCTFYKNLANDDGGAIYISTSDCVFNIYNSSFLYNTAYGYNGGGAIYIERIKNGNLSGVTFIGNRVTRVAAFQTSNGGAIYINKKSTVLFENNYFRDNHAAESGGAIYIDSKYSNISLKNNIFCEDYEIFGTRSNNKDDERGCIIYNSGSYGTIVDNWWGSNNVNFTDGQIIKEDIELIHSSIKRYI